MKQAVDRVYGIAGVGSKDVWVYLQDLAETRMIEFGCLPPEPGGEDEWRRKITPKKLADLARDGAEV